MMRKFLLACGLLAAIHGLQAAELDRIVAVVNNEVITRVELDARLVVARKQLAQQGTAAPPTAQLERQLLERLIQQRLELQAAKEAGIRIGDGELEAALSRIAENNKMDVASLRAAIRKEGESWEGFREDIRAELLTSRLRDREINNRVTVSDAELDAFLAVEKTTGAGREFQLAHILLRAPENASTAQWEALQKKADEVLRLVRQGDDFAKLAAAYSDAQDAMEGGIIDWRALDRLPTIFADAVPTLTPGSVSNVLRSSAGLHLVKLIAARDTAAKTEQVEQTRARHILLRNADGLSDTEARRRLTELRERISNGTDFAELARVHSSDLSAAQGGDLGWLSPGETVPDFERAMNILKPGELSPPVQSPFGWHLIQVQERRTVDVTDERRRSRARGALRERKADEIYEEWQRSLRDSAFVEIRLDQP